MSDRNTSNTNSDLAGRIAGLADEAMRAQGLRPHTPVGMSEPTLYLTEPMARSMPLKLSKQNIAQLLGKDGRIVRVPSATASAKSVPMSGAIIGQSLVAQAGAHVVVREDNRTAIPMGRHLATQTVPTRLRLVEPASFTYVPDDGEAPISALPVTEGTFQFADAPSHVVRFEIPRSELKRVGEDAIYQEVSFALVAGLAKLADRQLLALLVAADLAPFSLAHAASQGLRFEELRALAGTAANGAAVAADGSLRVAGVPAELTGDTVATIVGAWDRASVAIFDDVTLLMERTSLAGTMVCTVWANVIALAPDLSKFWKVEA